MLWGCTPVSRRGAATFMPFLSYSDAKVSVSKGVWCSARRHRRDQRQERVLPGRASHAGRGCQTLGKAALVLGLSKGF